MKYTGIESKNSIIVSSVKSNSLNPDALEEFLILCLNFYVQFAPVSAPSTKTNSFNLLVKYTVFLPTSRGGELIYHPCLLPLYSCFVKVHTAKTCKRNL